MTKNKLPVMTIKGVSINTQGEFKKMYTDEVNPVAETAGEAFEQVMKVYLGKPMVNPSVDPETIQTLEARVLELEQQLAVANETITKVNTDLEEQLTINTSMVEEIAELKGREPEKETIEVEKKLGPNQFILEVQEDTLRMSRKCRPFLVKDKRIDADAAKNPASFFNHLFDLSTKHYFTTKYDNIL